MNEITFLLLDLLNCLLQLLHYHYFLTTQPNRNVIIIKSLTFWVTTFCTWSLCLSFSWSSLCLQHFLFHTAFVFIFVRTTNDYYNALWFVYSLTQFMTQTKPTTEAILCHLRRGEKVRDDGFSHYRLK